MFQSQHIPMFEAPHIPDAYLWEHEFRDRIPKKCFRKIFRKRFKNKIRKRADRFKAWEHYTEPEVRKYMEKELRAYDHYLIQSIEAVNEHKQMLEEAMAENKWRDEDEIPL